MSSDDTSIENNKIFNRDRFKCRNCRRKGSDKGEVELHVHHIVPREQGGADHKHNLVTLCKKCHEAVHKGTTPGSVKNSEISDFGESSIESPINRGEGDSGPPTLEDYGDEDDRTP